MDRHRAERQERNFRERRNDFSYKHTATFEPDLTRRPKKRFSSLESDDEPTFTQRKKCRYTMETEHDSQRHMKTLAGNSRPALWEKPGYSNMSSRRTKHNSAPVPPYSGFSGFSGVLSPESDPEIAQPLWLNNHMELNHILDYSSGLPNYDSDGDTLMTDADSEKAVVENSFLIELDLRLRHLETAKKSWELEAKEFKANLSRKIYDAFEDFGASRYQHSRER